jgi:SAM-dependent methyltransferase
VTNWSEAAAWYDTMNPWRPCDDFYLGLVMSAERVLDVGCGTGTLLGKARQAGHRGRLCGLDRDPSMLDQARQRSDVDWMLGDAASARWDQEFDLVVMTGHAFSELVADDEIAASLQAIRAALAEGGRFAFETRHPQARAWEHWNTSDEYRNPDGDPVLVVNKVLDVTGDVVRLTETMTGQWWDGPHVGLGTLRFLALDVLAARLRDAGFTIGQQFGDWDKGPLTPASTEIITTAWHS